MTRSRSCLGEGRRYLALQPRQEAPLAATTSDWPGRVSRSRDRLGAVELRLRAGGAKRESRYYVMATRRTAKDAAAALVLPFPARLSRGSAGGGRRSSWITPWRRTYILGVRSQRMRVYSDDVSSRVLDWGVGGTTTRRRLGGIQHGSTSTFAWDADGVGSPGHGRLGARRLRLPREPGTRPTRSPTMSRRYGERRERGRATHHRADAIRAS